MSGIPFSYLVSSESRTHNAHMDLLSVQRVRCWEHTQLHLATLHGLERGSSAVECRTRNHVNPDSNPPLLPFRKLGIFVFSTDPLSDSSV